MKGHMAAGIVLAAALIGECREHFLTCQDQIPDLKAPTDKALCVVLEHDRQVLESTVWLDGKVVGGTGGSCDRKAIYTVTTFQVPPGEHLVVAQLSPLGPSLRKSGKVKFTFVAGRVYFVQEVLVPIGFGTIVLLVPLTGDEAKAKMESDKEKQRGVAINPNCEKPEGLSDADMKSALEDWAQWAKDKPDDAKKEIEYPGY